MNADYNLLPLSVYRYSSFRIANYFFRSAGTYIFDPKLNWNQIVIRLEISPTEGPILKMILENQDIDSITLLTGNGLKITGRKLNLKFDNLYIAVMPGHPNRRMREITIVKIKENEEHYNMFDTEVIAVVKFTCRKAIEKYA